MLSERCKNIIKKLISNQVLMICALLSVIYLLSGYCKWIEIGVSVCALIFMAKLSIQGSLCIFMFVHSFTLSNIGYNSCFMVTLVGYCLILFGKYCYGFKHNKYEYHKKLVVAIIAFYAVSTCLSLSHSFYMGAWLYFTYLPIAYFIFAMRNDIDISQAMNYMFGGLLTSCILAVLTLVLPNFGYTVIENQRFRAFINNTNYLHMRAIFVVSYYMYRHLNGKISNLNFILTFFLCSIIALSTLSKTGMAMLLFVFLMYLILYLKKDFKKNLKYIGIFTLVVAIVCVIGYKYIIMIFNRFSAAFKSSDFLSTLLTQRDEIWRRYFKAIFSSPWKLLFGHGLLTKQLFIANIFGYTETHNFYIFLLYRFGVIGTVALGYIVYLFIKHLNKETPKFIAYLPLIYLLLVSMCDNTMKMYNISYFIFAFMILFMDCKSKTKTHTQSDNKIEESVEQAKIEKE